MNTSSTHHRAGPSRTLKCKSINALKIAAIAGAMLAMTSFASGDEIVMRDGTVYTGTIVSRNHRTVEMDTSVHGISARIKLDRRRIKSIVQGDPSPATTTTTTTSTTVPTPAPSIGTPSIGSPAGEPAEDIHKVLKRDGYNLLLEVPMKGGFGDEIYPGGIADSFEWAKENEVTDVVLRINSGGGEIWCSNDIVTLIKEYESEFKIHMLIESAISASIWPSFACDTITMTPGSDFGGAVVYSMTDTGSAEVDKKMNGIRAAKLETTADANGHETLLVKAMTISKAEMYAYEEDGEWLFSNSTEGLPDGYETIDGPDTVLTLTAKQAIRYGLVNAMPDGKTLEEFARVQGIDKWDSAGNIGYEIVEKSNLKSQKLRKRLESTLKGFIVESGIASTRQYKSTLGSSLQRMRKHLATYKRLLREAKKLHMPSIVGSFDDAIDVTFWEEEIETRMAELRRMP